MKEKLTVDFCNFWPNFDKRDNYFFNLLNQRFNVIIDDINPQLMIFSYDYAKKAEHRKHNRKTCVRIYYGCEYVDPLWEECDFAITNKFINDERHFRLPLWTQTVNWFGVEQHREERDQSFLANLDDLLEKKINFDTIKNEKSRFCNFIYAQPRSIRTHLFQKISAYKHVDSFGPQHNNTGYVVKGRGDQIHKVMSQIPYKFTASFENELGDGWTTEKLLHPMIVNSIPIYWGNPKVGMEFNTKSFISAHDYENEEQFLEHIRLIDSNDDKYYEMLAQPWFNDRKIPFHISPTAVLNFIESALNTFNL
jgi:hypothetical protein